MALVPALEVLLHPLIRDIPISWIGAILALCKSRLAVDLNCRAHESLSSSAHADLPRTGDIRSDRATNEPRQLQQRGSGVIARSVRTNRRCYILMYCRIPCYPYVGAIHGHSGSTSISGVSPQAQ